MKAYVEWIHIPLDLGTSWRRVVSFTPRPLYPRGKSARYPLDRRVVGWTPEPFWTLPGLELRPLGRPARSQSLYRLHYIGSRGHTVLNKSHFSTNIMLDVIHRPVFKEKHRPVYFSKYNVSETGLCLRLQVKSLCMDPRI
jgi:hypothetical protein